MNEGGNSTSCWMQERVGMAINVNFAGVRLYPPGGSGVVVQVGYPGFTRHDTFEKIAHNHEDPGVCLAFLRALRNARIISGVRSNDLMVFHINATVPQDV